MCMCIYMYVFLYILLKIYLIDFVGHVAPW